jgi:dihydroorotate dehydrogenase
MLYPLLKSVLFSLPPEKAHDLAIKMASLSPTLGKVTGIRPSARLGLTVGNCEWNFPIGLAAGLDKNAEALDFFAAQGFGAIECGTITLRPQEGNPKPRMHRYPEEESLRNSMGFPNKGLQEIWPKLRRYQSSTPLGANIGKNKESGREESIEELTMLYESLADFVDYFVVNVSSPNTPGLRAFQEPVYLKELFSELNLLREVYNKDLYLKIAPDLEVEKINELATIAAEMKLTGLIATNTTIMPERGPGGMSGKILAQKADFVRRVILDHDSDLELIGVGGVSSFHDLLEFWLHGGKAMQVYTSYIYRGPELLHHFQKEIIYFLDRQGLYSLEDFLALSLPEKAKRIADHPR